jgi:hypothetical protein
MLRAVGRRLQPSSIFRLSSSSSSTYNSASLLPVVNSVSRIYSDPCIVSNVKCINYDSRPCDAGGSFINQDAVSNKQLRVQLHSELRTYGAIACVSRWPWRSTSFSTGSLPSTFV